MTLLRAVTLREAGEGHPFDLPVFEDFTSLEFTAAVTFLVGDNGCGKSTLLEIIAAGTNLPSLGQAAIEDHPLMAAARQARPAFRFVRGAPPRDGRRNKRRHGFFFRADDVTGFLQSVARTTEEHTAIAEELSNSIPGDWGRERAVAMAQAQGDQLRARYGEDPFARSHGELYLDLFKGRIAAPGLYLLDEPETPLSPGNQLALMALIMDAADSGSQFIIATHSPILMALPGAEILDVNQTPPASVAWEDVEHVSLTRAFLNDPESFLRHL